MNHSAFQFVRPLHTQFLASVALVVMLVMVVMVTTGCSAGGQAFNPVSGKLTIDGQIPANVQVSFYPVDGKGPIASGNVDAGTGRYELTSSGGVGKAAGKGAVAGKYKVVLNVGGSAAGSNEAMMGPVQRRQQSGEGSGRAEGFFQQGVRLGLHEPQGGRGQVGCQRDRSRPVIAAGIAAVLSRSTFDVGFVGPGSRVCFNFSFFCLRIPADLVF